MFYRFATVTLTTGDVLEDVRIEAVSGCGTVGLVSSDQRVRWIRPEQLLSIVFQPDPAEALTGDDMEQDDDGEPDDEDIADTRDYEPLGFLA